MARIIVNCDDFGLDEQTNLAIAKGFRDRIVSSTSFLANMPGFSHAQDLIDSGAVPQNAVGMHFNLTQGIPLTDEMKSIERFCKDGRFHGRARDRFLFCLSSIEAKAVRNEFKAQLTKLHSIGLSPSHIDGHHHIHTEWAIYKEIRRILFLRGPMRMRLSRTHGFGSIGLRGIFKMAYKQFYNHKLRTDGFSTTDVMGEFPDFILTDSNWNDAEIMVHFVPHTGVMCLDGEPDSKYVTQAQDFLKRFTLINYSKLRPKVS
jgi:predicted glycoside hydrolase/deacetylase ChbG (UPF0249 family)